LSTRTSPTAWPACLSSLEGRCEKPLCLRQYTAELEKLLAILMERDAEAVANLRSVMESWDKLSPADKKFIINTISYALKSVKERMNE